MAYNVPQPGVGTLLIGYDVEWMRPEPITGQFLQRAAELHQRLQAPATLFVVGRTLENWVSEFRAIAADPLFDLQQHTYSHQLLKTVHIDDGQAIRVVRGATLEQTRDEVRRTTSLLREQLGVECIGLTGPWCYYRGLRDRPDILEILWEEGIRFTRTDGRNEHDYHPVSIDLQPYWYDALGFPGMLEIPIHGWHDCVIRESVLGWQDLDGYVASVKPYLDRAADEGKVFSLCQHDWSSIREDPDMRATEAIIRYAQERGLRIMSYLDYYEECRERRALAPVAA
ncbi:MAG TPA: polysaccharide deacetylase family protein [Roseiflexaceae bacterium]|nr:polysaccharide deacetylase family protein [Roseiflexaceae bacterium]